MKKEIFDWFNLNIHNIESDGGGGLNVDLPTFELTPRDFIAFAENDLKGDLTSYRLVNATSNLKRATDCELDFLLTFLKLDDLYRKKKLGIDRKLGFFSQAGIFNARSLEKLNVFRNRLEHHYEIPDVHDVDVYFDLVTAFVSIGESFVSQLMSLREIYFYSTNSTGGNAVHSEVDISEPRIELILDKKENQQIFSVNLNKSLKPNVETILEFAFLLKVHILLIHLFHGSMNNTRFLAELEKQLD